MGCCASCPRSMHHDEYVFYHAKANETTIGYQKRYPEIFQLEPVTLESMTRRSDSGFCSDYLNRLSQHDEKMIQRNYNFLLENIMATSVTPRLVEDGILLPDDETDIRKSLSHRAQAVLLIHKLLHSKPTSFATFLNVLRKTDQECIAFELEKDTKVQENVPKDWPSGDRNKIERMLMREKSYILDELDPDKIIGFLVEREIFNIEDILDITFKSRRDKARIVLDRVLQNLPYAFNLLLYALKMTESETLADRLSMLVSSTRDDTQLSTRSSNGRHRGYIQCETKDSNVRIQMKITICLGDDEDPLRQAEASVVERINGEEWENVRRTLFKETESLFKKAVAGSLIIHLTPCSKRAYTKLMAFCQHSSFENVLRKFFSDEKTKWHVPQGPLTIKVKLLASGVIEEYERSDVSKFRDRIIEEFDTVVDEINPMNFKSTFIERGILSEVYFKQLDQTFAQCGSARATDFVEKVLEFGEDAVLAFMETIERKGPEYLLGVLKKDSTTLFEAHDNDEFIAKLETEKHYSSDSNQILLNEMNFHIAIHEPDDSYGIQPANAKADNPRLIKTTFHTSGRAQEPDIAVHVESDRRSSTSDYTSQNSSRLSNETQCSRLSESDPTMDLEGDLKNE